LRILHVAPSYYPAVRYGGPIWSVRGLVAAQVKQGHDVHVFTTNADGPERLDVPVDQPVMLDGAYIHYFELGSPARLYRSPPLAEALVKRVKDFDIVHLHSVFLWPTLKAARAAQREGVPYVVAPRGMMVKSLLNARSGLLKRSWIALFERKTLEQAAFIHATAEVEAEELRAFGFTLPPIVTIANGVEPPALIDESAITAEVAAAMSRGPYILSLGRLSWKKNLLVLLDAIASVPDARLILAGNDDEDHAGQLQERINTLQLQSRVTLLARAVSGADKEALFAHCTMFALPSLSENFGNTALEAMARGKPVVVSTGCGVADLVREAEAGIVCAPDAPVLGAAINQLLEDQAQSTAMGARGRALAEARYGWPSIAHAMDAAYAAAGVPNG
jgi:glycosyltransferase involved in cell wall biosynthesis